jgi:hypothetical protein
MHNATGRRACSVTPWWASLSWSFRMALEVGS